MINFRFHVVSIFAVFLALGIGIATGATVVDRGLVARQKTLLDNLDTGLRQKGEEVKRLKGEVQRWEKFASAGEVRFVQNRPRSTPIVLLAMEGAVVAPADDLARTLRAAGARVAGTVTLSPEFALNTPEDRAAARTALGLASARPETIRYYLHTRVRDALLDPDRSPTLETLERAGFVGFRGDLVGGPIVPLPTGARVVIVMTGEPLLDETAMLELVASLSESGPRRVVVAESAANRDTTSEPEPAFVRRIRADDNLNARLSTVDDLDRLEGRVTTVLALEDLARQEVGHYGLDKSADRLLPEAG